MCRRCCARSRHITLAHFNARPPPHAVQFAVHLGSSCNPLMAA